MADKFLTERERTIEALDDQIHNAIVTHGGDLGGKIIASFWYENNLSELPSFFSILTDERLASEAGIEEWQLIFYGPRASSLFTKIVPDDHQRLPIPYRELHWPLDEPDIFRHKPPIVKGEAKLKRATLDELEGLTRVLEMGQVRRPMVMPKVTPGNFLKHSIDLAEQAFRPPRRRRYGD